MEKVRLPRKVTEAIDYLLQRHSRKNFLAIILKGHLTNDVFEGDGIDYVREIRQMEFDDILQALINGYEVEQTPEGKIKEFYELLKANRNEVPYPQKACEYNEAMHAVRKTLDLLSISIRGVNT